MAKTRSFVVILKRKEKKKVLNTNIFLYSLIYIHLYLYYHAVNWFEFSFWQRESTSIIRFAPRNGDSRDLFVHKNKIHKMIF